MRKKKNNNQTEIKIIKSLRDRIGLAKEVIKASENEVVECQLTLKKLLN